MKLLKLNLSKDIEEILTVKRIIDKYWIDNKEIEKKTSLEEFVDKLDMSKQLFIHSSENIIVPFSFIVIDEIIYLFYVSEDSKGIDLCINALEEFKFNFNELSVVPDEDIIAGKLINKDYWIVNNQYMILDK